MIAVGRTARFGLLLLLPLVLAAAGDPGTDVVAQRGTVKLTAAEVKAMIARADPALRAKLEASPAALADFVRDQLLEETLLAEAHAANWDQKPEVIARANDARDKVIAQTYLETRAALDPDYPSDAAVQAAYEANKQKFVTPAQYHVAQIAILVPPNASKDVNDAARRKAQELRQQALKPKADFADLARRHSEDKASAKNGGDLGWVREDQLVPAVRAAVTNLSDNAVSEPVRSPDAWHVVKVLGIKPAATLSLDQVRAGLVQALRQARQQQLARAYVEDLLRREPIQLNEIDLAHRISASQ